MIFQYSSLKLIFIGAFASTEKIRMSLLGLLRFQQLLLHSFEVFLKLCTFVYSSLGLIQPQLRNHDFLSDLVDIAQIGSRFSLLQFCSVFFALLGVLARHMTSQLLVMQESLIAKLTLVWQILLLILLHLDLDRNRFRWGRCIVHLSI
jgi:hypothetical protein